MRKIRKKGCVFVIMLMVIVSVSPLFSAEAEVYEPIIIESSYDKQNSNISIVNVTPTNGSLSLWPYVQYYNDYSTSFICFQINHSAGKLMNYSVWSNATGSWQYIDGENDNANGTYCESLWGSGMTEYDTTYYWSINVTNFTDLPGELWENQTFWFSTGNKTHINLLNLTPVDYLTWAGSEFYRDVWSNSSYLIYPTTNPETMVIDIYINNTQDVSDVNVYMGDLVCYTPDAYWINGSNITMYVSSDNITFFRPEHDIGFGNGTFSDAYMLGPNITINASTWGANPNNPWDDHGDGFYIQRNCSIYVRFLITAPYYTNTQIELIDDNGGFHTYDFNYVFINGSGVVQYHTFQSNYFTQVQWFRKPAYINSTWGPPDFDQKQSDWYKLGGDWTYCGPTALLDCLWWLDCKYFNMTGEYILPDITGLGSKDPSNVIPLIEWIAENFTNTTKPATVNTRSGTSAENMTSGIQALLNYSNTSWFLNLEVEGYEPGQLWWEEIVNYTNVTSHLDKCDDVILLLGFWCEHAPLAWGRIGGHYVQANGYDTEHMALSFSDPYKDNAYDGNPGWSSTHTHGQYGNGSHNWTQNVSYDYYGVSLAPDWFSPGETFWVVDNYTDNMGNISQNWTNQSWYDTVYLPEGGYCNRTITVIEVAWYIEGPENCSTFFNKTIWNGTGWTSHYEDATYGTTITTNLSVINYGNATSSMVFTDGYHDAFVFRAGESTVYFSNGSSYLREPDYVAPCGDESCMEDAHGWIYWYFNGSEGILQTGESMWIHTNWTVNNTRYSANNARLDVSLTNSSCLNAWEINCSYNVSAFLNSEFNTSITCDTLGIPEASNWSVSESVGLRGNCMDQDWYEYETDFDTWMPYDWIDDWEWTYRYYTNGSAGDDLQLSYTIAANSCSNRSQSLIRMRYRDEEPGWCGIDPYVGTIYSFINNSYYDMVLYSYNETLLLSKRGDSLYNSMDMTSVDVPSNAYNYFNSWWSCNQTYQPPEIDPTWSFGRGIWAKTIWSDITNSLQVKAWNISSIPDPLAVPFGMCSEPSGWIYDGGMTLDETLLDFYSWENRNDALNIEDNHPSPTALSAVGQSFDTPPGTQYNLVRAMFNIRRTGTPDGNMYAALYEVTDCGSPAFNTSTGSPLAISEPVPCMSISSTTWENISFFFSEDDQYLMNSSYRYSIVAFMGNNTNADGTNFTEIGDDDAGTHVGNELYYDGGGWLCWEDYDAIFYVYGDDPSTSIDYSCFGLVTWNPCDYSFYADFDFIEEWRVNYSRDEEATESQLENHSIFGSDGIPLIAFPTYHEQTWENMYENWTEGCYNEWIDENISNHTYADCSLWEYQNITELYNLESRAFYPEFLDCGEYSTWLDQNDSIYYYTAIVTNLTAEGYNYENGLIIEIQDCTDGHADQYDGAIVGIDVDNNMEWDNNDMMFVWYDANGGAVTTNHTIWKGNQIWDAGGPGSVDAKFFADFANCTYGWKDEYLQGLEYSIPTLHRYSGHRVYYTIIPLSYLRKNDGSYLQDNDTFGLHIMTLNADPLGPGLVIDDNPVWENWNESNSSVYIGNESGDNAMELYLNLLTPATIDGFYFGTEGPDFNESQMQYWGQGRIQGDVQYNFTTTSCNCSGVSEESCVNVQEDVFGGSLDHNWTEYEPVRWFAYNTSDESITDWEWTYRYDCLDGNGGDVNSLSYTIANLSCSNMSQSILRMRTNYTLDTFYPYIGTIYSFTDDSNFDMVLYSYNVVYLLSMSSGYLVDTVTGINVSLPGHAVNHWGSGWTCNGSQDPYIDTYASGSYEGIWAKTLYSEYCGGIYSKAWGINATLLDEFGQFEEPCGWIANESVSNLTNGNGSCFGLVMWNPHATQFTADFDFIRQWRINSSEYPGSNATILSGRPIFNNEIPYMEFPAFNMTNFNSTRNQWLWKYYDWLAGGMTNLTFNEWTDYYTENLSRLLNLEARMFNYNWIDCSNNTWLNDQNDSIYYYTGITTALTTEEGLDYDNALRIHVEDCSDGTEDIGDGCVVLIDTDNNMMWDEGDGALVFYDVGSDLTNFSLWVGNTLLFSGESNASNNFSFFATGKLSPYNATDINESFPVFHRYSWHRTYDASIPLCWLRKANREMLNVNDTFGLHVMTFNAHDEDFPMVNPVWENWDERNCSYMTFPGEDYSGIWDTYLNCTSDAEIMSFINGTSWNGVDSSNIQYWGLGFISNTTGYEYQDPATLNITNVGNISAISDVTIDRFVEYNVTICNNGSIDIFNVVVNVSLPSNVVYLGSNLSLANVTNTVGNYYLFNLTYFLRVGNCLVLNISTRFPAGCAPNGTTMYMRATTYGNNSGESSDSWGITYGDNILPQVLFEYPTNTSTTVSILNFINNISVNITDADGDSMNVTFYTNKTDLWPPGGTTWHAVGANNTVVNGTYYSNATLGTSVWFWGDTTYYWWVNITDGKGWTNESYWFTTTDVRFDVNHNYFVNVQDVSYVIANYSPPYNDGIYDVNGNGNINVQDVSYVIANYT